MNYGCVFFTSFIFSFEAAESHHSSMGITWIARSPHCRYLQGRTWVSTWYSSTLLSSTLFINLSIFKLKHRVNAIQEKNNDEQIKCRRGKLLVPTFHERRNSRYGNSSDRITLRVCVYIYMYIHTCIDIYICIYVHIYIPSCSTCKPLTLTTKARVG